MNPYPGMQLKCSYATGTITRAEISVVVRWRNDKVTGGWNAHYSHRELQALVERGLITIQNGLEVAIRKHKNT